MLGRWDDSSIHGALAASLAVDAEQGWLASICHAVASFVPSARGQWDEASDHVAQAARGLISPDHVIAAIYVASARAHLAAARNDHPGVIEALQPLLAYGSGSVAFEPGVIVHWEDLLVEALAALGQHDEAQAILEPFETRAARYKRHSAMAAAARARGVLLAARHDVDAAVTAFERGLDHAAEVDIPFDRARLDLAAGGCLRRAGQRNAAAARLTQASAAFEHLGARPYLERSDRELAACGRRHASRTQAAGSTLTAQELAVARLATKGLSNKQIARELIISPKTVEYHLGHVYTKLQVSSRVQLTHQLSSD